MKILVANPSTQWPVKKGTDRLIVNLVAGLSADHEVFLAAMAGSVAEANQLRNIERRNVSVRTMVAPNRRSVLHRAGYKIRYAAGFLLTGIPPRVRYAAPDAYLRFVADIAREQRVDLVLANYWHLYRLPQHLGGRRAALVTHDLDFLVNPGRIRSNAAAVSRFFTASLARALERVEMMAYTAYDTILTVTASDAEVLARHPIAAGKTVLPLPLGIDLSAFKSDGYQRGRNKILFLGALSSDFNRDALSFFVKSVFPSVLARIPDATLEVVGYGADESIRREAGRQVVFKGGVDDVFPFLGTCSLMVLPLRFCGGVRIRLMEAGAMSTPVVGTPVAVAGMAVTPGRDYLEATAPDDMADAIVTLLKDDEQSARLGRNLRAWAERTISMETYPARLNAMLKGVMNAGNPAPPSASAQR